MSNKLASYLLFFTLLQSTVSIFAIDFVFNGFNSSDISLFSSATIESRIITLAKAPTFSNGQALYPSKIQTKRTNSSYVLPFSASFIIAMTPYKGEPRGNALAILFVPRPIFINTTYLWNNRIFRLQFSASYDDRSTIMFHSNDSSFISSEAGYWPDDEKKSFKKLKLHNGKNYQVWIDYADSHINVTMVTAGRKRPKKPLLSAFVNLSPFLEEEMYVGFSCLTTNGFQTHRILAWCYSNDDPNLSNKLVTSDLPSFELPKDPNWRKFVACMLVGVVCIVIIAVASLLCVKGYNILKREKEGMEYWELEYWPHKFPYQEIKTATKNFSDENVIGIGGNGKVYKGVLSGGVEVAVKTISLENGEGIREFESEISSIGRLKHKNLVGLRGWCKKQREKIFLIYDYMENGSLDKMLFECDGGEILNCKERIRILNEVACVMLYLHEGWDSKVLHRDIKSSNVLLDKDMNARLGDFGLARIHDHNVMAVTTRVVGTVGYLAPELIINTCQASSQTDVYSYGVLILEVICGRRPIEQGKPLLVDFIFQLLKQDRMIDAIDERIRARGEFEEDEEEITNMLHLGLLCTHPDPSSRPTIRQVVNFFEGNACIRVSDGDEDMRKYLLEKIKSKKLWSINSHNFRNGSYPTFEELRDGSSLASSMPLSWSSITVIQGR